MARTFKYSQMLTALVTVHNVAPEKIGALEGTLRYLRRYKVPYDKPGRGKWIEYTDGMVLQISLAIEMMKVCSQPPNIAAPASRVIINQYDGSSVFWAKIKRGERLVTMAMTPEALHELLQDLLINRPEDSFCLINVGRIAQKVQAALNEVAQTSG
jgi:hypothetical protein